MEVISLIVAIFALLVSLFTAWLTMIHRGTVKCTRPTIIAFSYDYTDHLNPQAKIFLRTLLYCTAKRGCVLENIFLRVSEGDRKEEFSFWGYGEKDLVKGSGLYIPESGVATNHHFNPLNSDILFLFSKGKYKLELVAKLVGKEKLLSLKTIQLDLPFDFIESNRPLNYFINYNWSPEKVEYTYSKVPGNKSDL